MKRFFVDVLCRPSSQIEVQGKSFKHMRASRIRKGDAVEVFDAEGHVYEAELMSVTRESAVLRVIRALKSETKAAQAVSTSVVQRRPRITLGIAMPKGSRGDWLVEKATELGVTAIAPLAAERSILKVEEGARIDRWRRLMNAAAEQSLTPVIPSMSDPITIESLLSPTGVAFDSIVWGCMPGDEQFKPKSILSYGMSLDPSNIPKNALMLIGPEGDFSFAEKEMLVTKGAHAVFVSSNRLRTETAAIAMLSILAEALRLPSPHKPLQN